MKHTMKFSQLRGEGYELEKALPLEIEEFLTELATFPTAIPGACEAYARAAATLLLEKYCGMSRIHSNVLPGRFGEAPCA